MNILIDLIIILAVSAAVLYISTRLKLPSLVGFLTAGVLVGPNGIELISSLQEVNVMAEIGILLLLFSIGIEFSLDKLIQSKKYVLIGGSLQVGLSIALFFLGAYLFGLEMNQAFFVGMLFAMSSTAIVLQLFQEKGWMNALFGKSSVSILIFQDIIIIPMMLVTPYLAASGDAAASGSLTKVGLGLVLIVIVVFAARKLVPPLMRLIVHTRNQELFLIIIIVICFATAFTTQLLGLKLALGAFLAGLVISESEYSFEALKNIMPFKKIFTAIFFISVGMLLNLAFVWENMPMLIGLTLAVMLLKFAIVLGTSLVLKIGRQNAIVSGIALCQVGEFAFILSKVGLDMQMLDEYTYQTFLAVSIVSMIISAVLIGYAPAIAKKLVKLQEEGLPGTESPVSGHSLAPCGFTDHVVIIGFGPGGKRIAKKLSDQKIPVAAIEINQRIIHPEDHDIATIIMGNGEDAEVLERAAVEAAGKIIITVPEASVAESITSKVRKFNHNAQIIVRSKYASEVDHLEKLGATQVLPEEISFAENISKILSNQYKA